MTIVALELIEATWVRRERELGYVGSALRAVPCPLVHLARRVVASLFVGHFAKVTTNKLDHTRLVLGQNGSFNEAPYPSTV